MSDLAAQRMLGFVLWDFLRLCWVSDNARVVWGPRLRRIAEAVRVADWACTAGTGRCALMSMTRTAYEDNGALWASRHVTARVLGDAHAASTVTEENGRAVARHTPRLTVVVGAPERVAAFEDAWQQQDAGRMADLAGHPVCCQQAFERRRAAGHQLDHTWEISRDTNTAAPSAFTSEIDSSPLTNVLWRTLGVRAIPHVPCRWTCDASLAIGQATVDFLLAGGYSTEAAWLVEMLSWPMEWSGLHGIAELKTPILRLATRTDATADKHVVRWLGSRYPDEGSSGITFPYRRSRGVPVVHAAACGTPADRKHIPLHLVDA